MTNEHHSVLNRRPSTDFSRPPQLCGALASPGVAWANHAPPGGVFRLQRRSRIAGCAQRAPNASLIARWISRFDSRSAIAERLSYCFLPRASANSSFSLPLRSYKRSGTSV